MKQVRPCSTCMNLTFRGGEASQTNLMSARPNRRTLREEPKMSASAVAVEVVLTCVAGQSLFGNGHHVSSSLN